MITHQDRLILIDAGSGLFHLRHYGSLLEAYDTLDLLLTHYHHDHLAGLPALPAFWSGRQLNIWGPGRPAYSRSAKEILETFTSTPFFPLSIDQFAEEVLIRDYDESGFALGELGVEVMAQEHADPTFAFTLGKYVHYATDTSYLPENFRRAAGTQLLIHECWGLSGTFPGHTSAAEIREGLRLYPVPNTWLIHANPTWSEGVEAEIAGLFSNHPEVVLCKDQDEMSIQL